jgi:SAM-dependent methyltransferase
MLNTAAISTQQLSHDFADSLTHTQQDAINLAEREIYWNEYYKSVTKKSAPSQFAAFIANELSDYSLIVDVGCGNGRDTLFFAQLGFKTIGIDGSASAIAHCKKQLSPDTDPQGGEFFIRRNVLDLPTDASLLERITQAKKIIYSRFFLHAIDEIEEQAFFEFAYTSCKKGDAIAVEFRTSLDAGRSKVTGQHYRRYIDAKSLVAAASAQPGIQLSYLTEGTGYAKYKTDDAHVCRAIFLVL